MKKKSEQDVVKIGARIARTNGKSNCIIATNGKYRKHTKQAQGRKANVRGRLLVGRRGREAIRRRGPERNADPRRRRGHWNPPRFRRGVGSGARLRSARGCRCRCRWRASLAAHTSPFQPVTAAAAASAGVRLDWIGLDWTPSPPHWPLPPLFPLPPHLASLLLPGPFPFGISPAPRC